jgi:DNA polymerase III subunit beta
MRTVKATVSARVAASDLKGLATFCGAVVERRNTIPVIGCIRLEVRDGWLGGVGTNIDLEAQTRIAADTKGEGAFLIDKRTLAEFAATARGPVDIRFFPSEEKIELQDEEVSLRLNAHLPVGDFPRAPGGMCLGDVLQVAQDDLSRLLGLSCHCISTEETRYYLNGVFLTPHPETGRLRAVATDGHRMAVIDSSVPGDAFKMRREKAAHEGFILPRAAVARLASMLTPKGNEPVLFWVSERWVEVHVGDRIIRARGIDGDFPDYIRVIPRAAPRLFAHLSGPVLRRLARVASTGANYGRACIELDPKAGRMIARENGDEFTAPLQADALEGVSGSWGFSSKLLAAQARVTPTFSLKAHSGSDAAIAVSEDPAAFWVLMPMRVS